MLNTQIVDGGGDGHVLKVNEEGAMGVVVHTHPPIEEKLNTLPFRQYLTDNGKATGSEDMRVDGSVVPSEFCVVASPYFDIYIKSVAVVIADAGATLSDFGSLTALSNGIDFSWVSQDNGTIQIHDALKSNFDFVQLGLGTPAFGSGNSSFKANNVVGTSEAFIPVIDFKETFGLQWGVRLRKGTLDKLCFIIKDNILSVDRFDAISYGIKF
jgi:hypothetical protein